MNLTAEQLMGQLAATDEMAIEIPLREAYDTLRVHKENRAEMRPCWTDGVLVIRIDLYNWLGELAKTIRVPLNSAPQLKTELHREGALEFLMEEIRHRIQSQSETLLAMIEAEMFKQ
jgi:hypothetical protein